MEVGQVAAQPLPEIVSSVNHWTTRPDATLSASSSPTPASSQFRTLGEDIFVPHQDFGIHVPHSLQCAETATPARTNRSEPS
jgi:hypothetical protein